MIRWVKRAFGTTKSAGPTCDCCGRQRPDADVRASAIGPVSWRYCQECEEHQAEPAEMVEGCIRVHSADGFRQWAPFGPPVVDYITVFTDGSYVRLRDWLDGACALA